MGKMLDLGTADFSAIHRAPNHEHLRRGIIERRELSNEVIDPGIVRKLQRFQTRLDSTAKRMLRPKARNCPPTRNPLWPSASAAK